MISDKPSVLARAKKTSWMQRLAATLFLTLALAGFALIGQGTYIKAKAVLAQALLENAWGRALAGEIAPKAWAWADTWPVAKINVPRLRKNAVVLKGTSGEAMAFGPGHMAGTPMPGQMGTSIFAAHRDTHFEFLKNIVVGDLIEVTTADSRQYTYTVDFMEVVNASASGVNPQSPDERLALVTCWPFGERSPGPLRYVVYASPVKQVNM